QGEYTLLVAGNPPNRPQLSETELKNELLSMIKQGISRSQASREIAKNTGLSRRYLYQLALTIELST
ncbi:MAG: 16S rRNA methyltransferase, partial [Anabaena sp. MDT14b]